MANNVQIDITAKDNASAAINQINGALSGLAKFAGAALIAAGTAVTAFVGQSIMAAARVDELAIINQVLAKNAGLSGKAVIDAAAAVRSMGIESAISQQVVAQFVRSNLDLTKASELARVAQDAATISGLNSTDALNQMITGIITLQPEMLRAAGITVLFAQAEKDYAEALGKKVTELTVAEKQQAALNATLEAGVSVAGAYEAAMGTASKQIRSWPRYLNDLMVAVGKPFQESFNQATVAVSSFLKNLVPLFEKLRGMDFVGLTQAFQDSMDNIDWGGLSQRLADGINKIDWATMGANFKTGVDNVFDGIDIALNEIKWGELSSAVGAGMMDVMAGFTGQGDWDAVKATWSSNAKQFTDLIKKTATDMKSQIPKLIVTISFPSMGVFIRAAEIIQAGMQLIADAFNSGGGGFTGGKSTKPKVTGGGLGGIKVGEQASGTPSAPAGWSWVGEAGPELVKFRGGEQVMSNARSMQQGGGMTVNLTYAPAFSTASQSEFLANITPMLNDWYRRRLAS